MSSCSTLCVTNIIIKARDCQEQNLIQSSGLIIRIKRLKKHGSVRLRAYRMSLLKTSITSDLLNNRNELKVM